MTIGDISAEASAGSSYSGADGYSYAGGIVGENKGGLSNCYNTGNIYSQGRIALTTYKGGIVGTGKSGVDCYYLEGTAEGEETKCTAEEMKVQSTFDGFDFDSIWVMDACRGYPQLQDNMQFSDEHVFCDWQVRTLATCTGKGEEYRTCACGEEEIREILPLGHSFTKYIDNNDVSCTENGTETAKCDRCDATDTRDIENSALGHDYSEEWTIDRKPTCTEPGRKSHHCARCDAKTDITEILATGHSFGEWFVEKPASITEDGLEVRICSVCQARDEKILSAGDYIIGDINSDGSIDIRDLISLKKIAATSDYTQNADLTEDNKIDALDLAEMRRYLFKIR